MAFEYRSGMRMPARFGVDSGTAAITVGMALTITDASTDGYVKDCDAAEAVLGIAMEAVASPTTSGDATVLVDISTESVYECPADTGTLLITEVYNTADVGSDGISVNRDASGIDDLFILTVDTVTNTALVQLRRTSVTGA